MELDTEATAFWPAAPGRRHLSLRTMRATFDSTRGSSEAPAMTDTIEDDLG
jgi:hypothetical protein